MDERNDVGTCAKHTLPRFLLDAQVLHTGLLQSYSCDSYLWCLKYSTVPKREGRNSMLPAKLLSKHFAPGAAPVWFQGAWLGGSALQGSCLCYAHSLLAGKQGAKISLLETKACVLAPREINCWNIFLRGAMESISHKPFWKIRIPKMQVMVLLGMQLMKHTCL